MLKGVGSFFCPLEKIYDERVYECMMREMYDEREIWKSLREEDPSPVAFLFDLEMPSTI